MLSPKSLFGILILAPLFQVVSAVPFASHGDNVTSARPPAFFLAGDSTTAVQSSNGGGWGVGFLSTLKTPAWGTDYGLNGATTVSFVKRGRWADVISSVQNSTADYDVYVTIQVSNEGDQGLAEVEDPMGNRHG